jgi:hypothetical protein
MAGRSRHRTVLSLALALGLLLSACVGGSPVVQTWPAGEGLNAACGAWRLVPSPNGGPGGSFLSGTAVASARDAWAVGVFRDLEGRGRTLTLHWDGRRWAVAPSPNAPGDDFLNGVDALPSGEAWAVGMHRPAGGTARTLALHLVEGRWRAVRTPNASASDNVLSGVSVRAPDDAWAVGSAMVDGSPEPLALHWNGSRWSTVPTPAPPGLGASLSSVWAGPREVWAAGTRTPNGYPAQPLVLRWGGSAWERSPDPVASVRAMAISSVAATGSGEVVAVGGFRSLRGDGAFVLTGTHDRWAVVARRTVGLVSESFSGVAATGATVWAVGSYTDGGPDRTLIEHRAASGWGRVPSPSVPDADSRLFGVAALPSGEAWAVGTSSDPAARERTLIVHYCPSTDG